MNNLSLKYFTKKAHISAFKLQADTFIGFALLLLLMFYTIGITYSMEDFWKLGGISLI
jgi:hypothetical protein